MKLKPNCWVKLFGRNNLFVAGTLIHCMYVGVWKGLCWCEQSWEKVQSYVGVNIAGRRCRVMLV
jgi:hypothetical protein